MENNQSEAATEPRQEPRKEYTLKQEHEHGGELLAKGDKVKLTARQAERLKKQEKI